MSVNAAAIKYYPFLSIRFIGAYIITMRPYLMFISGITGISGLSFADQLNLTKTLLIFLSTFLSYGFGQALTDCFQIDTDSLSSPYRPLTQRVVSRNHFLFVSGGGLLFCISILTYYNPINILLGLLAGTGLATYTFFKRKWWAGPFYNSWIVVVLFIMSYLAGSEKFYFDFNNSIFISGIIVVFFGYANFVLTGYFKDIEADRKTFYNTLPVIFGRRISAFTSDIFAIIASVPVPFTTMILTFDTFSFKAIFLVLIFSVAGIGTTILTQLSLHSVQSDEDAHKAIVLCVHSYILILSGLTVLNKPEWFIPLIIFYALFIITLKLRPAKEQI